MGYGGVIVTDDLEMKAIADRYSIEETIELGLEAGIDLFLICHTEEKWRRAFAHLVHLVETQPRMRETIMRSAQRVRRLKAQHLCERPYTVPHDLLSQLGTPEHIGILAPVWA
jgi:beta-N-acetylhexosaminidase